MYQEYKIMTLTTCVSTYHPIGDSDWTPNLENVVRSWALKAAIQREMHHTAAKRFTVLSTRLSMPVILLTTITSVGSFGAADSDQYKMWMYVTGGLNLFSAFLASMVKYLKPDERCASHNRMAKLYDAYYRDLIIQLNLAPEERCSSEAVIDSYKARLQTLIDESPLISDTISRETMAKNNISPPDDFRINIYGREVELETRPLAT
jgi:hypothetical protein